MSTPRTIRLLTAAVVIAGAPPAGPAQGTPVQRVAPNPAAKVATHYFYWYRWPDLHFKNGRTAAEDHFHHFVAPQQVSFEDPEWHLQEFRAMASCGIDFALPVYWGAPGAYDQPTLAFSRRGLPPMVQALTRLAAAGEAGVRLGLFYDTSTLLCDVRGVPPKGGKADLRTAAGRALFADTVIGFFAELPARFWARIDGRALVVLYSSHFAAGWDAAAVTHLRAAFRRRFPDQGVFLVADRSWGDIGQDRTTGWGAAIHGPVLLPGVAQIGPGFDDSPVPGRITPIREREGGNFYRYSWRQAVAARPGLVLIETWNEMHEGSEICATVETGRRYLDLTREWIGRLRSGELGPPITLRYTEPRPRTDRSWGAAAAGAGRVFVDFTGVRPERSGLRELDWQDGAFRIERRSLRPRGPLRGQTFVYFQVSDFFRFDDPAHAEVVVDYTPVDGLPLRLQYDSGLADQPLGGRYTEARARHQRGPGAARRVVFDLPRARFANRQNGLADFRLRVRDVRTAIRRVELRLVER